MSQKQRNSPQPKSHTEVPFNVDHIDQPNEPYKPTGNDNAESNTRVVSFQDEQDQFVPMNTNAVPFYKRTRGCFNAEGKALERAIALEASADNGKPTR